MNNAFSNIVANMTARSADNGDDVLFAACCDLRSTVDRGLVTVTSKSQVELTESLRFCVQQLPAEHLPRILVGCMAALQGLCPNETWSTWQRLNGC